MDEIKDWLAFVLDWTRGLGEWVLDGMERYFGWLLLVAGLALAVVIGVSLGSAVANMPPEPTPTPYPHGYQHRVCQTVGYIPISCGKGCEWWMPITECHTVTEP